MNKIPRNAYSADMPEKGALQGRSAGLTPFSGMSAPSDGVSRNPGEATTQYARSSSLEDMYLPYEESPAPAPEARRRFFRMNRFASALVLLLPAALAFSNVPATILLLNDTEAATDNALTASPLDFSLSADQPLALAFTVGEGEEEGYPFVPFVVPAFGTTPFAYRVYADNPGGTPGFCAALKLNAVAPLFDYTDDFLLDLATPVTTEVAPWSLFVFLPPGSGFADGDVCTVELVYAGFQDGGQEDEEFHDEERFLLVITADILAPLQAESFSSFSFEEPPTDDAPLDNETQTEEPTDDASADDEPADTENTEDDEGEQSDTEEGEEEETEEPEETEQEESETEE